MSLSHPQAIRDAVEASPRRDDGAFRCVTKCATGVRDDDRSNIMFSLGRVWTNGVRCRVTSSKTEWAVCAELRFRLWRDVLCCLRRVVP
jgi:hypothetical protein